MEPTETTEQLNKNNPHKNRIHKVLAYSYFSFFIAFLLGLFLDFMFPLQIFNKTMDVFIGTILLVLGTFLVIWAQKTSRKLSKENISKETFCNGPYRYTRSPTHYGLFFLMLGFGSINNALFILILSVVSFLIAKFVFLRKEENILIEKYGTPYLEYKKSVKL